MAKKIWEQVVAEKRRQRAHAISTFARKNLSGDEDRQDAYKAITEIDDINVLAGIVSNGKFTSEDVTLAYITRKVDH
jgi:amidase